MQINVEFGVPFSKIKKKKIGFASIKPTTHFAVKLGPVKFVRGPALNLPRNFIHKVSKWFCPDFVQTY